MNDLLILERYLGQAGQSTATLEVLLRVTVLLLLAALAVAGLRRSSAALRHLVWTLSLAGALLIPLFFWAFPAWRWAILPGPEQSAPPAVASVAKEIGETPSDAPPGIADSLRTAEAAADASPVVSVRPVVTAAEQSPKTVSTVAQTVADSTALPAFDAHRTWSWPMLLATLWALGTCLGLLWLAVSIAGAWHVARRTQPAADPCWHQLLNQLRAARGSRRPIGVRECSLVSVPMTWGLRRPVILVPAGSAAWSEATKRSVLLHELGHIRRGDCLVHLLGRLACVAYWFHPLIWLAARQMRKTSERAADDAVLASHIAPPDYAEHLVAIAAQVRGLGWFSPVALPMASPSDLEGRVLAILDPERNHRRLKGRTCCALVTAAMLLLLPCALLRLDRAQAAPTAKVSESNGPAPTAKAAADSPATLGGIVERVRQNEALFRDLDCTVRARQKFREPEPGVAEAEEPIVGHGGPLEEKVLEESYRAVTQNGRLYFQGEGATLLPTGKKPSERQLTVFDGSQTVSIQEGNCVTIHQGRYEPAQLFPPHCWPLFTLQVNFSLSVYLQGTEAIKSCAKVRHFPHEAGSNYEFNQVESQRRGEEAVDGLACVKVRVKRWHYSSDPPEIQDLWLAVERNFHVARCRTVTLWKNQEVPDSETRVVKWRELAKGVWLPEVVEWTNLRSEGRQINWVRRLVVEKATGKPRMPATFFRLPPIPPGLPKYAIGADGRLVDAPHYPTPVEAAPGTTLPAILKRLGEEEKRYERLEMAATNHYRMLNRAELDQSGVYMEYITRERSIAMGDRLYFRADEDVTLVRNRPRTHLIHEAYDGRWLRGMTRSTLAQGRAAKPKVDAWMHLGGVDTMRLLRPHTLLFHDDRINSQRLSAFLASGWYDTVNHYPMTVEYVGDERVDGLSCHKLKCLLPHKGSKVPDIFFFLWLARDHNLLPVRHEWREPGWSEKLPTGIAYVEDLREIRSGIWCPYHMTSLAHQKHGSNGLVANNIVLQWRRDLQVDKAVPDPKVDEKLFGTVEVPQGTEIAVRDDEGDFVGRFKQPTTGNMELSVEKLRAMQHDAGANKMKPGPANALVEGARGKPAQVETTGNESLTLTAKSDGSPVLKPDSERAAPPELMKTLLDTNRHWLRPDPHYLSYTFSAALPARGSQMRYQVEYTAPNRVTIQGDHRQLYKGLVDDAYDPNNSAWAPRRITLLQGVTLFGPLQELAMAPEGHALSVVGEEPVDGGRAWVLHLKATKGASKEALERWDERLRRRAKRSKYFYEFTPVKKEVDGESRAVIELKCAGEEGPGWKELVAAQQNNPSDIDWGGCRVQAVIREYRGQVRPVIVLGRTGRGSVTSISFLEGGVGNVTPKLGLGEGEQAFDEATYQKLKAQSSAPKPVLPMRVGCGVFGSWYGYSGGGADVDQLWVDKATGRVLREEGFYGGEPRFVVTYGDFAAIAGGGQVPRHIVVTLFGKPSDPIYPWVFDMEFQIVDGKTWLLKELKESQGEQQNVATATVNDASVSSANRRQIRSQPADAPDDKPASPKPGERAARPSARPGNGNGGSNVVSGRVTDAEGKPLEGVTVRANCGVGTLFQAGSTQKTDKDGRYTLRFADSGYGGHGATAIFAHKSGFAEKSRSQGGSFYGAVHVDALDFVLVPAPTVDVELLNMEGKPFAEKKLCLSGERLPPACNALKYGVTDAQGHIRWEDVPPTFACWFLAHTEPRREVRTASMIFAHPGEYRVQARLGRDAGTGLDVFEIASIKNAKGEEVRNQVVADEPLAHAPLSPALQAKGQEILAKVAEANRYWLDRPPPEVRSYRYDFGFIPGQRKSYEVANNVAASGVPRPGLSAASFLADVIAHPHSAVFRQIDVTPDEIAMTFTFTHMVPGHPDNGVTAIASGCFNHGVWEGTIVVDPKTFTPRRCNSGAYRETFFDYQELRPGHFVPLRVRMAGGLAFDLRFHVYEPGLWLFTASYWDDVRRSLGLAAQVDNVVVNGKPVRGRP